jgi:hypothetical protein
MCMKCLDFVIPSYLGTSNVLIELLLEALRSKNTASVDKKVEFSIKASDR